MEKTYTVEKIRQAFWETFHRSGELWFFNDLGTEEEDTESTNELWEDFKENLINQLNR